jgi:hypothetical protein
MVPPISNSAFTYPLFCMSNDIHCASEGTYRRWLACFHLVHHERAACTVRSHTCNCCRPQDPSLLMASPPAGAASPPLNFVEAAQLLQVRTPWCVLGVVGTCWQVAGLPWLGWSFDSAEAVVNGTWGDVDGKLPYKGDQHAIMRERATGGAPCRPACAPART